MPIVLGHLTRHQSGGFLYASRKRNLAIPAWSKMKEHPVDCRPRSFCGERVCEPIHARDLFNVFCDSLGQLSKRSYGLGAVAVIVCRIREAGLDLLT